MRSYIIVSVVVEAADILSLSYRCPCRVRQKPLALDMASPSAQKVMRKKRFLLCHRAVRSVRESESDLKWFGVRYYSRGRPASQRVLRHFVHLRWCCIMTIRTLYTDLIPTPNFVRNRQKQKIQSTWLGSWNIRRRWVLTLYLQAC